LVEVKRTAWLWLFNSARNKLLWTIWRRLRWLADARGWYNSSLYVVALATLERVRDTKE